MQHILENQAQFQNRRFCDDFDPIGDWENELRICIAFTYRLDYVHTTFPTFLQNYSVTKDNWAIDNKSYKTPK